jgi:hypothetical protein
MVVQRCDQVLVDALDMRGYGPLEYVLSFSCQDNVNATPVLRGVLSNHETSPDHPVDQARHAAGRERNLLAEPAHSQPAPWRSFHVDEDVEENRGDANCQFELAREVVGEMPIRMRHQAHKAYALIL